MGVTQELMTAIESILNKYEWSLREVGRQSGVSASAMSLWTSGKREIRLDKLIALLQSLGLTMVIRDSKGRTLWTSKNCVIMKENE
ncbi:MAG: helix-turn-helix transcriptional regulator [Acidaminococcus intestini]|uniref:Helix-turn-helix transcriptional regulator n=1 Tax=Acidaminococcus intestini TaxID=187327 RepID=A0A943EEM5_9FIRM|nr:helix-turn-helix transcriptional regulator [Acidaminococcus intestini]